jgi:sugar phosphate permease
VGACIQAIMGLASGVDYAARVKLISAWFGKQQRGSAYGIYMTGDIAGGGSGQQHNAAARWPMDVERRVRDPGRSHGRGRYHLTFRDR